MIYSLTLDELTELLRAALAHDANHHLLLLLAFRHGLRVSEATTLTCKNVVGEYLRVQRLKNSRLTTQPLIHHNDPLWDEVGPLRMRIAVLKGDHVAPIFPSPFDASKPISRFQVRRLMHRYGREAGIPEVKLHPHALKHSCGMMIIGAGIEMARDWLGHRSIASTGFYLKPDADAVARAVNQAFAGKIG